MFLRIAIVTTLIMSASSVLAMGDEDPLLLAIQSEFSLTQENQDEVMEWEVDVWLGHDLNKLWIKSEGEHALDDSQTKSADLEVVFARAISPFWDAQFGLRHDFQPKANGASRSWVSIGFMGTAPFFVQVDARLLVGEESSTRLLIELEKEIMLTQRWVLIPELDLIANSKSNEARLEGRGLASIDFELKLGYRKTSEFQPFAGLSWRQSFAGTRRLEKSAQQDEGELELMIGFEWWH